MKRISTTDDVDKLYHLYNVSDSKYATDNTGKTYMQFNYCFISSQFVHTVNCETICVLTIDWGYLYNHYLY